MRKITIFADPILRDWPKASLAQPVEHRIRNAKVVSSNLIAGSIVRRQAGDFLYICPCMKRLLNIIACVAVLAACTETSSPLPPRGLQYARWLDLTDSTVVSISPFDGSVDTLRLDRIYDTVVCMSSSYAAGFAEIGKASCVAGISGRRYLTNPSLKASAVEVGSDAALDYERVLALNPDVGLVYGVSSAEPAYVRRLGEMGIRTFRLYDHLESSPLGRAEYMRAWGALTGCPETADSIFLTIREAYDSLKVPEPKRPLQVMVNAPLGDAWYIPGLDNFFTRMIADAGGEILGSQPGTESSTISLERAFLLSRKADVWLNPGSELPKYFPAVPAWDNTLRTNENGGNDFWERGMVRPDLVLSDLVAIFRGDAPDSLYYFRCL